MSSFIKLYIPKLTTRPTNKGYFNDYKVSGLDAKVIMNLYNIGRLVPPNSIPSN